MDEALVNSADCVTTISAAPMRAGSLDSNNWNPRIALEGG